MKIANLGTRALSGADLIAFSSNQNINQYDVFIVQLSELSSFIGQFAHLRGATFVPAGAHQSHTTSLVNALSRLNRQFDQISEVIEHGASLVVVLGRGLISA